MIKKNFKILIVIIFTLLLMKYNYAQSISTYMNPVIPGDHPDPTLTKIGNDFYTSGSSFNPTPKIYHSTDLVHWEVIAQPVSASWTNYHDVPGGGVWGGHMVFYNGSYWHYFGKGGGSMYFVKADKPEGPWNNPTQVNVPIGLSGLGVDNSIFIDEDSGKWYMLTKNGRENNHIVELDLNGQPNGNILDLTWLNPDSLGNPYGWAEGPVMWKDNGYYYYSFAQHLAGSQYVMRSDTLTDNQSDWTIVGTNIFIGTIGEFSTPNHISPAVLLDDGTSWVIAHSYRSNWFAQGRQGLLCELTYTDQDFPRILRPSDDYVTAPNLANSGIPWMVPHTDLFDSEKLNPEWSFLGYTPDAAHSLTERPGWLRLTNKSRIANTTIIKNDGEHNYALITRVDFEPANILDEAGLMIINGPQTLQVKVFSSITSESKPILVFSFNQTRYEVDNTIGSIVWLKLIRDEHNMSGYFSDDGINWTKIGKTIDAEDIDIEQTDYNDFTGNQQGLYVKNKSAYFDLYIYRDAYSPISATIPVNQYGTSVIENRAIPNSLGNINNEDWALYAGVEFGNNEYPLSADSVTFTASSATSGGVIEIWLDSLNSNSKIAECLITNTGDWNTYKIFKTNILTQVSGNHDVYLKFRGNSAEELMRIQNITFNSSSTQTAINEISNNFLPNDFILKQNYPNPFNPSTTIEYSIPYSTNISIKVFDLLGREVITLFDGKGEAGKHYIKFNGSGSASGIYFYRIKAGDFMDTKKLILLE